MAISETGHAINLANFESLISYCRAYGTQFRPAWQPLQLSSLEQLFAAAKAAHNHVHATRSAYNVAVNERRTAFQPLRTYCTKLVSSIIASGASEQVIADVRTINRKVQGQRAPSGNKQPNPDENKISVSQQSFDSLIDHLGKFHALASALDGYAPNEPHFTVAGIADYVARLRAADQKVIEAYAARSNSYINRTKIFYGPQTGLVPVALSVRAYIKAVFGTTSDQYRQSSKIRFRSLANQ